MTEVHADEEEKMGASAQIEYPLQRVPHHKVKYIDF